MKLTTVYLSLYSVLYYENSLDFFPSEQLSLWIIFHNEAGSKAHLNPKAVCVYFWLTELECILFIEETLMQKSWDFMASCVKHMSVIERINSLEMPWSCVRRRIYLY